MLIENAKVVVQYIPSEFEELDDADTIYEYACMAIDDLMDGNTWWYASVRGFGWRKQSGYKVFRADSGRKLLRAVLPDTDNSFKVYAGEKPLEFAINNCHHDAPMWGQEWYTIRKATEDEIAANT